MAKPVTGWTRIITLLLLSLRLRGTIGDRIMKGWYKRIHRRKRK